MTEATAQTPAGHGGFWKLTLGSIGVVYGDIGTSPLYAMRESLHAASRDGLTRDDVIGVISLLIWTLTLIVTALCCWALFRFLNRTRAGKAMRAYSDNEDLALLSGINPERVVMMTWIIATALAVTAGTLYGLDKSFKAFNYFQILLPIFWLHNATN